MRLTRRALLAPLLAAPLLPACVSHRELLLDEALFGRSPVAPESRLPGRVAVRLQPAVKDLVYQREDSPVRGVRLPVGQIVGQAMLASAADAFAGGVERPDSPADDDARPAATIIVQSARVSYDRHLLWLVPLPLLGGMADSAYEARLAIDVTVVDPRGRVVWTRSYDDGPRLWEHKPLEQGKAAEGYLRLTHEAAWRLAQQALGDLREWAETERSRPRDL